MNTEDQSLLTLHCRPLSDPQCVVDAVIFSLRENGYIFVYIPSYAIKGPCTWRTGRRR